MPSELSISHILGTSDILGGSADHLLMELGGYYINKFTFFNLILILKLFVVWEMLILKLLAYLSWHNLY